MTTTTAVTPAVGHPMNKRLGFGAMIASATGMGLVGFLSRGAVPTHVVDGETVKYVLGDFLATGRMLTGALGFLLILLATRKWTALRTTRLSFSVVAGGLAIGMSLALYVSATLMTTIANAVFLIYTGPLFSAILAWIFLKEKISLRNGLFLAMVFGGMLLTIGLITYTPETGFSVGLQLGTDPEFPMKAVGDLFALGSGVFYGLALFFYRYRGDMDSGVRGFWNFVFGAVGALAVMALRYNFLDDSTPSVMTRTNWMWAAALFLVCGFFAIGFLVVAGKHLSAVELSVVAYWETVVALFIGYFIFGETMTPLAMLGGVMIVVGGIGPIVFMFKSRGRDKELAETESEPVTVTQG
ncbi:MAG: DMT family transporter [Candidatus Nanopelagicales bacterium]